MIHRVSKNKEILLLEAVDSMHGSCGVLGYEPRLSIS
jgi:hypothetical protein